MPLSSLTRRRFLVGCAASGIALLCGSLAACGGPSGPASDVPEDTLRVAYPALNPSLDPHDWRTPAGPRTFAPLFDSLTFVQDDGKLRPSLAVSWSQLSSSSWQFKLRVADAKFSNGELFGPESVKFSLERLMDPSRKLALAPLVSSIDRVDIVNPWTLNLLLKEPDPLLPRKLSLVYMLPPTYFGQVGEAGFLQQPVGTGFWQLVEFDARRLARFNMFRDTWRAARGADPSPLQKLELAVFDSSDRRAEALTSLQVDVACELEATQAQALAGEGFLAQTKTFPQEAQQDRTWQADAFGAALLQPTDVLAADANVKGIASLPNGAWWFDRVTKTPMQRVAVAGGA